MKNQCLSPKKNIIISTRQELKKLPIKYSRRRKSSIPLQLKEFITGNGLNHLNNENSPKKSHIDNYSSKKHFFYNLNNNIPEESESAISSVNKNNKKYNFNKNGKQKNNYYINYVKNIYENESHFNNNTIVKSKKKNFNNSFYSNIVDSNQKLLKISKRRNSAFNHDLLKLNFLNNICLEKDQSNKKMPTSSLNKLKSAELSNLLFSKNLNENEKDYLKSYMNKKSKSKSKKKNKNKKKDSSETKNKNNGKNNKNDINIYNKTKIEEKESEKVNDFEKMNKTQINGNNNNNKSKMKKISLKKFFCCLINKGGDSSIENE